MHEAIRSEESNHGDQHHPVKLRTPRFRSDALETWLTALQRAAISQPALAD